MKSVKYNGTAKSVNQIMDLVGFTTGINNCVADLNKLLFCGEFFDIGTLFCKTMVISTKGNYNIENKKIVKVVLAD